MNDLEICTRIAEIEGIKLQAGGYIYKEKTTMHIFNPLADDALCFRLMGKYLVTLIFEDDDEGYHAYTNVVVSESDGYAFNDDDSFFYDILVKDDNPNRAVLLAIIAKYKEQ
jgi:hypothetical protein